jgi:acyl-CoA synthetase (AMP-forming)/AMP-acid ligase II
MDADERTLTFATYQDAVERAAAMLHAIGVGPGTTVGWQLPTWLDSIVLLGALSWVGATQIPMLPLYRERDLSHVLRETSPPFLFVPGVWKGFDYPSLAAGVADAVPGLEVVVVDRTLLLGDSRSAGVAPKPSEVRWIYYTSGTTGAPKGARHTDASLIAAAHSLRECYDIRPTDRGTIAFPVTHVGGVFMLLSGFISGCAHICFESFDGERSIELMRRQGVTFPGNGTAFELAYLAAQRRQPGTPILPLARAFPHGGDPKRPHVHQALKEEIGGVGNLSGYGLTEFPMIAAGNIRDTQEHLAKRVGRPCREIEVRIVDGDGKLCGRNVEGEILARGPSLCLGYVDASINASAFDGQGFFRTGDLGFLDDEGYLEVTGRLKDVIIRKGEKISASELEEILHEHPKIAEATVLGLPDEERGERCCAVVVLRDPTDTLDLSEIRDVILARGLMRYKVPEQLEIRPALPRDFFGKVKKVQLRNELA